MKALLTIFILLSGLALALLSQLIVAKSVSVEVFGQFNILMSVASLIAVVSRLGFLSFIIKKVVELKRGGSAEKLGVFSFYSLSSIVIILIIISTIFFYNYEPLERMYEQGSVSFLGFLLISLAMCLNGVFSSFLRGYERPQLGAFLTKLNEQLFLCIFLIAIYPLVKSVDPQVSFFSLLVASYSLSLVFSFFAYFLSVDAHAFKIKSLFEIDKEWLYGPLLLTFVVAGQIIIKQADLLTVAYILGDAEAAIYSVATRLSELGGLVLVGLNFIYAPKIVKLKSDGKLHELFITLKNAKILAVVPAVIALIITIVFGRDVVLLFGVEYEGSYQLLIILMTSKLLHCFFGFGILIITMLGFYKQAATIFFVLTVFDLILNYFLVTQCGAYGAAFSTLIATLFLDIIIFAFIRKKLRSELGVIR